MCEAVSDSDGCGGSDETLTFSSTIGTTYLVAVTGHSAANGPFELIYEGTCALPCTANNGDWN